MTPSRDHGGGLDAAIANYGGTRKDWLDLSTGINPVPFPVSGIGDSDWTALPDQKAMDDLILAARRFWRVPDNADIIATPGASAIIARMPDLAAGDGAYIPTPTYNEHAAAFHARWPQMDQSDTAHTTHVFVHPNNPDGHFWSEDEIDGGRLTVIDESFCDIAPDKSYVDRTGQKGTIVLKSFGKFWGLAGLRLGFAIGCDLTGHSTFRPNLQDLLGPWAVAGPALTIGANALNDTDWAKSTRQRLQNDAERLDTLMAGRGANPIGGTSLFRLYHVDNAKAWQDKLAQNHIWSRVFPYSENWLRLGLPHPNAWAQLEAAL